MDYMSIDKASSIGVNVGKMSEKNLFVKIFGMLLLVVFSLVVGYFVGYKEGEKSGEITREQKAIVLPKPTAAADGSVSFFQQLLKRECIDVDYKAGNDYVYLNKLPFKFSEGIMSKYEVVDRVNCDFNFDSQKDWNSGFISLNFGSGSWENSGVLIGDSQSKNMGMRTHDLSYEKELSNIPGQRLIYDKNGIKILTSILPGEPCCWDDTELVLDFVSYKTLGEYKLVAYAMHVLKLDSQMQKLFKEYGKPVVSREGEACNKGNYQVCDRNPFESEFLKSFISDYDQASPEIKRVIDGMVSDLSAIALK